MTYSRNYTKQMTDRSIKRLFKRYILLARAPEIEFFTQSYLHSSVENIIYIMAITFVITLLSAFFMGLILNNLFIMVWFPILLSIIFLGMIEAIYTKVTLKRQELEITGLFLLNELKIILITTHSLDQALDYFLTVMPAYFRKISKQILLNDRIHQIPPDETLLKLLKNLELQTTLRMTNQILNDWKQGRNQLIFSQTNLLTEIQSQIDINTKNFESWNALTTALISLIPLMGIFLFMLVKLFNIMGFSLILVYMLCLSAFFWFLDPLGINLLQSAGINDKDFSNGWSAAQFSLRIADGLQMTPDPEDAILGALKELFPKFISFNNTNVISTVLGITNIQELLVDVLSVDSLVRLKMIIEFTLYNAKINPLVTITYLHELGNSFAITEQFQLKKVNLIKAEFRKIVLLLCLQAFTLGILLGLAPVFAILSNFSSLTFQVGSVYTLQKDNLINTYEIIFFGLSYLSGQIIVLKNLFQSISYKRLLFILLMMIFFSAFGFSFVNSIF